MGLNKRIKRYLVMSLCLCDVIKYYYNTLNDSRLVVVYVPYTVPGFYMVKHQLVLLSVRVCVCVGYVQLKCVNYVVC